MNRRMLLKALALTAVALAGTEALAGNLELQLKPLDQYRDFGFDGRERDDTRKEFTAYLEKIAKERLPENQTLRVVLTEFKRAGDGWPARRRGYEYRVMREITWPQMAFDYAVLEDGRVLREGKVELTDMNYLTELPLRYNDGDSLRYEKRMADRWFDANFPKPVP